MPRDQPQPVCGVYTFIPREEKAVLLTGDFDQPNGLCVSPDAAAVRERHRAHAHQRFTFDGDAVRDGTVSPWSKAKATAPPTG